MKILLLMYKLPPDQLLALAERARSYGMGTIGELGLSSYAQGIEAGLDAFVHTTRYSLGLAPSEMVRAAEPMSGAPCPESLSTRSWSPSA